MLPRDMQPTLERLFGQYPVVTLTGPRQSGKTTLARLCFGEMPYFNLEAADTREFADTDPRGFLAQAPDGAVIDEIQRVPTLLGYVQEIVDERRRNGMFVLTGSQQLSVNEAITQSLAGRTAVLTLLPLTIAEAESSGRRLGTDEWIYTGFYPRIYDEGIEPTQAYGDYTDRYVERDVRQLSHIRDLSTFRRFVKLCAGRCGQLLNLSQLAADTGISHPTAREWMSVLEASYLVFLLPPYHANVSKRLVKSPKLYFHDVGLASYLIGIENAKQIATHPLRGPLFENLVVSELLKHRFNRGRRSNLYFLRDSKGFEVDVIMTGGDGLTAVEVKAGATLSSQHFAGLRNIPDLLAEPIQQRFLVYDGESTPVRYGVQVTTPGRLSRDLDDTQSRDELDCSANEAALRPTRRGSLAPATRVRCRGRERGRLRSRSRSGSRGGSGIRNRADAERVGPGAGLTAIVGSCRRETRLHRPLLAWKPRAFASWTCTNEPWSSLRSRTRC